MRRAYFAKRGYFGEDGWIKISWFKYFNMWMSGGFVLKSVTTKKDDDPLHSYDFITKLVIHNNDGEL